MGIFVLMAILWWVRKLADMAVHWWVRNFTHVIIRFMRIFMGIFI